MQAPVKNFCAEVNRLANAVAAEKHFRAEIVGRVRVFFVCVSGMMKAG